MYIHRVKGGSQTLEPGVGDPIEAALSVFGLTGWYNREMADDCYNSLIRSGHPDAGGSPMLVQQVNAARGSIGRRGWRR